MANLHLRTFYLIHLVGECCSYIGKIQNQSAPQDLKSAPSLYAIFFSVFQRPMSRKSLKSGDVFILDLGLKLYQWNGSKSNKDERTKVSSTPTPPHPALFPHLFYNYFGLLMKSCMGHQINNARSTKFNDFAFWADLWTIESLKSSMYAFIGS